VIELAGDKSASREHPVFLLLQKGAIMVRSRFFRAHHFEASNQLTRLSLRTSASYPKRNRRMHGLLTGLSEERCS
jgi:hypothetical protein